MVYDGVPPPPSPTTPSPSLAETSPPTPDAAPGKHLRPVKPQRQSKPQTLAQPPTPLDLVAFASCSWHTEEPPGPLSPLFRSSNTESPPELFQTLLLAPLCGPAIGSASDTMCVCGRLDFTLYG